MNCGGSLVTGVLANQKEIFQKKSPRADKWRGRWAVTGDRAIAYLLSDEPWC